MRKWYEKYIGYCFCDRDGNGVTLLDVFYFENNGTKTGTAYEVRYENGTTAIMDYRTFKDTVVNYTVLPR